MFVCLLVFELCIAINEYRSLVFWSSGYFVIVCRTWYYYVMYAICNLMLWPNLWVQHRSVYIYLLYGETLYSYIEYPMRRPLICKYSVCYARRIFLSVFAWALAAVNNPRYRCSYSSRPFCQLLCLIQCPLHLKSWDKNFYRKFRRSCTLD